MYRYITLGIDEKGHVYGLELKDGESGGFRHNSLGYATSCAVIRPVPSETLEYCRNDMDSVREWWKMAVADDHTELGLEDYFKQMLDNDSDSFWYDEDWPAKDESFCYGLLEDHENQTLKAGGFKGEDPNGGDFRKHVEKLIADSDEIDIDGDDIATWESAGLWAPSEPFVIELAPREILDEYYSHLAKTDKDFKMNQQEDNQ